MEKEENKTKNWWKENWTRVASGTLTLAIIVYAISTSRKNKALKEENLRLKGANENYKSQVKGNIKTIEKISYFLGKQQNSLT